MLNNSRPADRNNRTCLTILGSYTKLHTVQLSYFWEGTFSTIFQFKEIYIDIGINGSVDQLHPQC